MTDHAKSLLSNLTDKTEEPEVHTSQSFLRTMTDLTRSAEERLSSYLRSTLFGRDCCEAGEGILGCDDPDLDVSQYFPVGNRGTILITTRNPDCKIYATAGWCELGQMEMEDAITLMLKTKGVKNLSDTSAREAAKPVVLALGCLALAVLQAGAMIQQDFCDMEEWREIYTPRREELLERKAVQGGGDY